MPLGRFLNHTVSIVRDVAVTDAYGDPTFDDYGQPLVTETTLASDVAAGIQPKRLREVALTSQAGVVVGTWTIFMALRDISEADVIVHDASACAVAVGVDLPDMRFEPTGIANAAGAGHHLEIDATLIESGASAVEVASGS